MTKTTFKITYRQDGQWQGTQQGDERPIIISPTQETVKEAIFRRARDLGDSRVLVFNGSGDETQERTFGAPSTKGYAGNWDL